MSIFEFNLLLSALIRELNDTREQRAMLLYNDAFALIRNRITNTGKDHNGKDLRPLKGHAGNGAYSRAKVPTWFFRDSELGTVPYKKLKANKSTENVASYEDFRKAARRRTDIVDLRLTGKMWKSMKGVSQVENDTVVTVEMQAQNPKEREKMEWNISRYGDFMTLSKSETQSLSEIHLEGVLSIISKNINRAS